MPDPERNTTKVHQSAIDEIKKLGMSKAIAQYHSGNSSPEFKTAVERYYSPQRLKNGQNGGSMQPKTQPISSTKPAGPPGGSDPDSKVKKSTPVVMPKSAPAAATRKTGAAPYDPKKGEPLPASKALKGISNWFSSGNAKAKKEEAARKAKYPPKPKPVKTQAQIDAEKRTKEKVKQSSSDPQSARMRGK